MEGHGTNGSGSPEAQLLQRHTSNIGYFPGSVNIWAGLGRPIELSDTWGDFVTTLERIYPRVWETMMLPFDREQTQRTMVLGSK